MNKSARWAAPGRDGVPERVVMWSDANGDHSASIDDWQVAAWLKAGNKPAEAEVIEQPKPVPSQAMLTREDVEALIEERLKKHE